MMTRINYNDARPAVLSVWLFMLFSDTADKGLRCFEIRDSGHFRPVMVGWLNSEDGQCRRFKEMAGGVGPRPVFPSGPNLFFTRTVRASAGVNRDLEEKVKRLMSMWLRRFPDDDNLKQEMARKKTILKVLFFAAIPIIIYNSILDFVAKTCLVSCFLLGFFFIFLVLMAVLSKQLELRVEYTAYQFFITVFLLIFGFLLIYVVGVKGQYSLLHWSYFYPILIIFSLGGRQGLPWAVLFLLAAAPFFLFVYPGEAPGRNLWLMQARFIFSYCFITAFSFILERYFHRSQLELISKQAQLRDSESMYRDAYEKLKDEIRERKKIESEKMALEAQVLQAQKMEAIYTLAGGIAHDFNNLLMAIQGNISLILLDLDSEHPQYEKIKAVDQYIQSGAGLTKQLLDFARGGRYKVKPTDLNKLVHKSSLMFNRAEKGIRIHRRCAGDLWTVEADQGQIEQVLMNLYINAWQSMMEQGELYLETENVILDQNFIKPYGLQPGKYVRVSVIDTGEGMDEATQRRVFEPFFTTKGKDRGTGLGLASAYSIVAKHDGIINLTSRKGVGTTFNVYLPATEKKAAEDEQAVEEIVAGSETILLVDDEDMIVEVFNEILKNLGYQVMAVRNGQEAIETYKRNKLQIDMVILDMIMPDMGGQDVYDHLKSINPSVKVLLSSGHSINEKTGRMLKNDGNSYIQKPFSITQLSQSLRQVLDRRKEERAA